MSIDLTIFKGVMSRFASGVTIVTVQHNGQRHGCSVIVLLQSGLADLGF